MKLRPLSLRYSGDAAALEQDFRDYYYDNSIIFLRLSLIAGILIFAILGILDARHYDTGLSSMLIIRYALIIPILALIIGFTYSGHFKSLMQPVLSVSVLVAGLSIIYLEYLAENDTGFVYNTSIILLLFWAYTTLRIRFIWAAATGWLLFGIHELSMIFLLESAGNVLINSSLFLASANILGMTAGYFIEYYNRKDFYLAWKLNKEKQRVDAVIVQLENRVHERTQQLEKTNENLKLEIVSRKFMEGEINKLNQDLEGRVINRTAQLEKALNELKDEIIVRKETEMKLLDTKDELAEALKHQQKLNELKSRFIESVSHEYRTPLTVILSSTYLLNIYFEQQLEDEFKKQLSKIQKSVKEMTGLLNDVLTLQRSREEDMDFVETINVLSVIEEEIGKNDPYKRNIDVKIDSNTKKPLFRTDTKQFQQIIANIISNAVKFSNENSSIKVEVLTKEGSLKITVTDSGIGIPGEDLKSVFDPFHRGSNVGAVSGTGLGLAIVKRCIDKLDGSVHISSKPGEYTSISVLIPELPDK